MSVCNYCGKDRNPTGNFYRHCGCDFSNESSKQRIEIKPSLDSAQLEIERLEGELDRVKDLLFKYYQSESGEYTLTTKEHKELDDIIYEKALDN